MAVLFDLIKSGPPPGTATTAAEQWIDLGSITSASDFIVGKAIYTAPDKAITFELRTNNLTKSAGNTTDTTIMYSAAITPKSGAKTIDMYLKGRIRTATVISTGVERWWLRLVAKSATAGGYTYRYYYALE